MKSEPDVFGISDLAKKKREGWDGVRNYQARNHMRAMAVDDLALFYHSSTNPPGVAGLARISKAAHPDPTQFDRRSKYYDPKSSQVDPRWDQVEVEFVEQFPEFVSLEQLKADAALSEMLVIRRGMRLSVQPVERAQFAHILKLARAKTRVR